MWLLRTLPNNVLGHIGIKYGLKGTNACITNHSVGGLLAVIESFEALRAGEADRVVAIGHETPIEPQMVLYYHRIGVLASETLRPFDAARDGSQFGEGAGALVLETEASAAARGAPVLGEVLGSGYATEGEGLLAIRADGDGPARAIAQALDDAGLAPADVGMIVAHANGTRQSDASEAAAIRTVFGADAAAGHRVQVVVRPPDRGRRHRRDRRGARGARQGRRAGHRDAAPSSIPSARAFPRRPRRRRRAVRSRSCSAAASRGPTRRCSLRVR